MWVGVPRKEHYHTTGKEIIICHWIPEVRFLVFTAVPM
jgi:hypothetical protein